MRVLFISLESRHTSLASIPTMNAIKESYPHAQIHYLLSQDQVSLLQRVPAIDKIFIYKVDATSIALQVLKEAYYHYIIDITRNKTSIFFTTYLPQKYKARTEVISLPTKFLWMFGSAHKNAYFKSEKLSSILFQDVGQRIELTAQPIMDWQIEIEKMEMLRDNDIPTSHSAGYYVLAVDCKKYMRQIQNLIEGINFPVILLGNQNIDMITQIKSIDNTKVYLGLEKFNEFEMLQIFQNSKLNIVDGHQALSDLAILSGRPLAKIGNAAIAASDLINFSGMNQHKYKDCKDLDLLVTQVKSFLGTF